MTSLEAAYAGIVDRLRSRSSAAERHLTRPEGLELVMASVPDWWSARGNRLFAPPGCSVVLREHPGIAPPSDAIVIVGPDGLAPAEIMLWGDAPAVLLGPSCRLPNGHIHCGGGSTIVIAGYLASINAARLSARNGGLITVGIDNLWGHGVAIQTDDMHAILDARTQRRVNRFGSLVEIGKHVWLGAEALVGPGSRIGDHAVVGARAVVTRPVPTGCVAAGIPARIVRRGITWSHADTPPDVSGPHFVTGRSRFARLAAAARGIRAGTLLAALRRS